MKKKDLLNEVAGVPRVLDTWVDIITTIIFKKLDDILIEGWDKEASGELENPDTGEIETHMAYASDKEYIGKDIMKEIVELSDSTDLKDFINSKTFQEFPLWQPTLVLKVVAVPDIHFNRLLDEGYGINARVAMDPKKQELSKLGKNEVVSSVLFEFDPILPASITKITPELKDIMIKSIKPVIAHELLHTYQSYMQMKGGKTGHFGPESILNALANNPLVQQEFIHDWNEFLRLVYLHLSFEVNARVNELYYEMVEKGVNTKEDFLRTLKESHIWKEVNSLKNFDAEKFIKDFKVHGMVKGNDNPLDFIEKMMVTIELKARGIDARTKESTLKSLIHVWDRVVQMGSQGFEQAHGIKIPMGNVPQKAKESPLHFFKFFEKRFHKKAKKFERKLYRLASVVLNQEEKVTEGVKKKALNEIAGVPDITKWNKIFITILMDMVDMSINTNISTWDENKKMRGVRSIGWSASGRDVMEIAIEEFLGEVGEEIRVGEAIKRLTENPDFNKLPLWAPDVGVTIISIPNNKWQFAGERPVVVEAGFNTSPRTKINKGVLTNTRLDFKIYVKKDLFGNPNFMEEVQQRSYSVISHELTHAYQNYKELETKDSTEDLNKKTPPPLPNQSKGYWKHGTDLVLNNVKQNMESIVKSRQWKDFLYLVYLHLSFEINARVSQLGHELMVNNIDTTEKFKEFVKNSEIYKQADMLTSFDSKVFIEEFDSPIQGFYDEEGQITPIGFWDKLHMMVSKSKRSEIMLKSLIKVWSKLISSFDSEYSRLYKNVPKMKPVPDYAKEDPIKFFEFFEKRFHEKGEEFKRKLYKLGSLVQKLERKKED